MPPPPPVAKTTSINRKDRPRRQSYIPAPPSGGNHSPRGRRGQITVSPPAPRPPPYRVCAGLTTRINNTYFKCPRREIFPERFFFSFFRYFFYTYVLPILARRARLVVVVVGAADVGNRRAVHFVTRVQNSIRIPAYTLYIYMYNIRLLARVRIEPFKPVRYYRCRYYFIIIAVILYCRIVYASATGRRVFRTMGDVFSRATLSATAPTPFPPI